MTGQFDALTRGIAEATTHLESQTKALDPELRLQELNVGIKPYIEATLQTAESLTSTLLQTDASDGKTLWDKYAAAAASRKLTTPVFTLVDFQGLPIEGNQPFGKLTMSRPGFMELHNSENDDDPTHFALVTPLTMDQNERTEMLGAIHNQNSAQIGGRTDLAPDVSDLQKSLTKKGENKPVWVKVDNEDKYAFLSPTLESTLTSRLIDQAKPMLDKEEPMSVVISEVKRNMELEDRMSAGVVASNINESFVEWTQDNSIPVEPSKVADYPTRADLK